jgi:PAS domain S-box-containing protein
MTLLADIIDSEPEELKLARARLLENQAHLEFVIEAADLGTWEMDLTTDICSVRSLRHDQMFGFAERQAEWGRDIAERHILTEDLPAFRSALARARATGQFGCEVRVRWPDGSIHWVAPQGQIRLDAEGRPASLRGVIADITLYRQSADQILAQKLPVSQANTALQTQITQRTDERDRLWASTNDLMGTVGESGYLSALNPAWSKLMGWTPGEIAAKPLTELIDAFSRADGTGVAARLAAGETVTGFIGHVLTKDGDKRAVMWNAVPDGPDIHIVGRDVTELQQAEEQLRQSQKMEAVGQLTGGIAHDFNNLLTAIGGSLELLQTRLEQGRIKDLERYLITAQQAAKRAAALTHRLLAFSRRQTLVPSSTNINRLVIGMEDLVRRTVGPSITVEVVTAGSLWNTLVDPHQLENALLNLSLNARDAMPDGGKLVIETNNRWLDNTEGVMGTLPAGQYVSLCVSDNGCGMPKDVIAHVFEPFFTTKPIGLGTGLGLSMVYGFARQSGGEARVYSEVGKGAMVCLYLPRNLAEDEAAEKTPAANLGHLPGDRPTVLVVDDEPAIRMLAAEVLGEMGCEVIEVGDAAAALVILRSDIAVDLLVTDVGLPGGMNGRQLVDAAREQRAQLKVLFITGYAENAMLSHEHMAPGMHVLTKPFPMALLASRVRELLSTS